MALTSSQKKTWEKNLDKAKEDAESIIETHEILKDKKAMTAIKSYKKQKKTGKLKTYTPEETKKLLGLK